jgi:S1-C subfamily serine protease
MFKPRTVFIVAGVVLTSLSQVVGQPAGSSEAKLPAVENSVVKVFSSVRYPDPFRPWTKQAANEVSGSGVVIEGKRILSNAHLVLYASQIHVQANQSGDRFSATVEAVSPHLDLAVLKLDEDAFFENRPPISRSDTLPEIRDVVMAYGYPNGGQSLSITKGIVSRIEFAPYTFPVSGLYIQIDAAINPGNSGGPAVVGDNMVGLTFSRYANSDNIGFIIPCEEISAFLKDAADGKYEGKPALHDELQTLENPALRSFLEVDKTVEGLVVHVPGSDQPDYPLKEWDVITKIGDHPLDNQGMVKPPTMNLRLSFRYLVQKLVKNGKVPLTVIRQGKPQEVQVPTMTKLPLVIPSLEGAYPSYFVYGPLVFSPATTELMGGMARSELGGGILDMLIATRSPLVRRMGDKAHFPGERLVVVASPFFPSRLAKAYDNPIGRVVKTVNDAPIKNIEHLIETLRDCKDEFVRIKFDQRGAETLVFTRSEMVAATDDILSDNGVRSQGSADMLAIWNAKSSR